MWSIPEGNAYLKKLHRRIKSNGCYPRLDYSSVLPDGEMIRVIHSDRQCAWVGRKSRGGGTLWSGRAALGRYV